MPDRKRPAGRPDPVAQIMRMEGIDVPLTETTQPEDVTGGDVAELLSSNRVRLNPDTLLTVDEIADRWRVSTTTIRRRCNTGDLPAGNIGTRANPRYRIRLADLLAYEINAGIRSLDSIIREAGSHAP